MNSETLEKIEINEFILGNNSRIYWICAEVPLKCISCAAWLFVNYCVLKWCSYVKLENCTLYVVLEEKHAAMDSGIHSTRVVRGLSIYVLWSCTRSMWIYLLRPTTTLTNARVVLMCSTYSLMLLAITPWSMWRGKGLTWSVECGGGRTKVYFFIETHEFNILRENWN